MPRLPRSLGALLAIACGCAGAAAVGPSWIVSDQGAAADLSRFQTYGYAEPLGTDAPDGTRTLVSTFLVNAIDGEMEHLGLRRSDRPDLLVNFHLRTQERLAPDPTPYPRRYRQGRHGQWRGYEPMLLAYTEGTLSIDLVASERNAVVWEGLAQGPMRSGTGEVTGEEARLVVKLIFEQLPR